MWLKFWPQICACIELSLVCQIISGTRALCATFSNELVCTQILPIHPSVCPQFVRHSRVFTVNQREAWLLHCSSIYSELSCLNIRIMSVVHTAGKHTTVTYRSYKNVSACAFLGDLSKCPFDAIYGLTEPDEALVYLCKLFPSQSANLPPSLQTGKTCVNFADPARNLGVIFNSSLSMRDQVSKVCQTAYLESRRIGSIRKYLTAEATKTLVSSLVISRLDYCNSLLAGVPLTHLTKLQRVVNNASRLAIRASKCKRISLLLADLHWLPVSHRIEYKIVTVCYNVISGSSPRYLADLFQLYTPSRSLRSSADSCIFHIPIRRKKFQGQRAFSYTGPVI